MAKKKVVRKTNKASVNKTQAIVAYMKRHPADPPRKVAEALTAKGVEVTAQYVSTIKANKLRQAPEDAASATTAPIAPASSIAPAKPTTTRRGSVTLDSLMHLKQVAEEFGGIDNTIKALDAIKKLQ